MKTDALIGAIVQDSPPRRPSLQARMAVALAAGGLVAAALFTLGLGMRPDVASALQTWRFSSKVAIALLCFAVALWAVYQLALPNADKRKAYFAFAVPVAFLAVAIGCELLTSSASTWPARAIGSNSLLCLAAIPILSIAPLAALLLALRTGAPRSPALAGAVAGLLAGALAAALYATHCIDDSPLFVALWYTPAVAVVVLMGAAIGSRTLRW